MENYKIIIPARRNSKGLPFKNRQLIGHTLNTIPKEHRQHLIITTDDEIIIELCQNMGIKYDLRSEILSDDYASMKDVIRDVFKHFDDINTETNIIMLYLTYPERTWEDVINAYDFFINCKSMSMLCKKEITSTHPYLYMYELEGNKGKQLVEHNLYRRQDYPKVFEISHFISIFKASELENLNLNLYNKNTVFYAIDNKIDVDTKEDLNKLYDK